MQSVHQEGDRDARPIRRAREGGAGEVDSYDETWQPPIGRVADGPSVHSTFGLAVVVAYRKLPIKSNIRACVRHLMLCVSNSAEIRRAASSTALNKVHGPKLRVGRVRDTRLALERRRRALNAVQRRYVVQELGLQGTQQILHDAYSTTLCVLLTITEQVALGIKKGLRVDLEQAMAMYEAHFVASTGIAPLKHEPLDEHGRLVLHSCLPLGAHCACS